MAVLKQSQLLGPRIRIPNRLELQGVTGPKFLNYYTFSKYVLQNEKLGPEHQQWEKSLRMAVNVQGLHKIVLLKPRGTYKTTFYTIGLPIWFHLFDPSLRILIGNAVNDNSTKFLSEINGHYLRNERLEQVYRQLGYDGCPVDPNSALTTSLRLTNNPKIQKEPNISVTGFGSSIVSQHYDIIIIDDLCDRNDRESVTVREAKKRWFSDLASLLEPDGLLIMVGTRWHFEDTYHYIINELNPKHAPKDRYHVESESCYGYSPEGIQFATYPRILSLEKLEELKIDKTLPEFAANYENNPLPAETQIFKLNEMTFFNMQDIESERQRGNIRSFGFCDPSLGKSKGDFGAIVTIGIDRSGTIYVLDGIVERMPPVTAKNLILQKCMTSRYQAFGIESNQFQELFVEDVIKESTRMKIYGNIKGINHGTNKQGRIESLQSLTFGTETRPAVIRFRNDWETAYPRLMTQLLRFPLTSEHDDAPDALEGAVQLARTSHGTSRPFLMGAGQL